MNGDLDNSRAMSKKSKTKYELPAQETGDIEEYMFGIKI